MVFLCNGSYAIVNCWTMIFNQLIYLSNQFANWLLNFVPTMTAGDLETVTRARGSISTLRGYVQQANFWFPVDTLFTMLKYLISIYFAYILYLVGRRVVKMISAGRVEL